MKINDCYVNQEPDYGDAAQPDSLEWELCVAGDRMIGQIYLPSGIYDAPHPAVIICHGIPGINCNDDLAQALRRMGCVVIRLCHRGSWGSGGTYSFTHCIEDAVAACRWAREEGARLYHIDPDNVFLIGHSAGGSTAINASRRLPFLKGTAAYCFLDHAIALARRNPDSAREGFRRASHILRLSSFEDLWQDHVQHAKEWGFVQAAPYFRERNLLLIGGHPGHPHTAGRDAGTILAGAPGPGDPRPTPESHPGNEPFPGHGPVRPGRHHGPVGAKMRGNTLSFPVTMVS